MHLFSAVSLVTLSICIIIINCAGDLGKHFKGQPKEQVQRKSGRSNGGGIWTQRKLLCKADTKQNCEKLISGNWKQASADKYGNTKESAQRFHTVEHQGTTIYCKLFADNQCPKLEHGYDWVHKNKWFQRTGPAEIVCVAYNKDDCNSLGDGKWEFTDYDEFPWFWNFEFFVKEHRTDAELWCGAIEVNRKLKNSSLCLNLKGNGKWGPAPDMGGIL